MPSCLGIYIDHNIIKYAKVAKDNNVVKIEASGVKFQDNIEETIKTIVHETFSFKTPISVNVSDEQYYYAQLFSMLNKKDVAKVIDSEFEYFCNDKSKNKNALQYKYVLAENLLEPDKMTAVYAYIDRAGLTSRLQPLAGLRVDSVVPLPFAIKNLGNFKGKKDSIIVNIERTTTATTIVNGEILRVDTISKGMKDILDNITEKENSYEKSYEICKNTTIYTREGRNLQQEADEHLVDIMPTLFDIVQKIKEIIAELPSQIENIYITGLAAVINNIDLYFQENFDNQKCEILTPFFVDKTNIKINIKDYIEVNSATALALQGLGVGLGNISFVEKQGFSKLANALSAPVGKSKEGKTSNVSLNGLTSMFKMDFGESLDKVEKNMIRFAVGLVLLLVLYGVATSWIVGEIKNKKKEADDLITATQTEIQTLTKETQDIDTKTNAYKDLIAKIDAANNSNSAILARKEAVPNLLRNIMFAIPKEVYVTSITNPGSDKKVTIMAEASEYEYLGFFIATLKSKSILLNVTSTQGTKESTTSTIKITITGELPY